MVQTLDPAVDPNHRHEVVMEQNMEAIILVIVLINIQSPQVLFFIPGARSCFTKVGIH